MSWQDSASSPCCKTFRSPVSGTKNRRSWNKATQSTKQTTDCKRNVAAIVPVDVVTKDLVSKDTSTKDPVNHVATQEVAQVKGRSGGSAKVKVKRREPEFRGADMLQSFSHVCRMFYFGSSHLFSMIFVRMSPIWLVDSGATCHIVSEKWVQHYTVSFEYQGPRPSLKGAGDNDLPVKGVVDLEFMVDKTKVFWETLNKVVFSMAKTKFPLKISDRAWWPKVTLPKRKGGKSSSTVPMDLSTVNTGNGDAGPAKEIMRTMLRRQMRNAPESLEGIHALKNLHNLLEIFA